MIIPSFWLLFIIEWYQTLIMKRLKHFKRIMNFFRPYSTMGQLTTSMNISSVSIWVPSFTCTRRTCSITHAIGLVGWKRPGSQDNVGALNKRFECSPCRSSSVVPTSTWGRLLVLVGPRGYLYYP